MKKVENKEDTSKWKVMEEEEKIPNGKVEEEHISSKIHTKLERKPKVELHEESRKLKPPKYDGESHEVLEAWLLNINRYFQVYDYTT